MGRVVEDKKRDNVDIVLLFVIHYSHWLPFQVCHGKVEQDLTVW